MASYEENIANDRTYCPQAPTTNILKVVPVPRRFFRAFDRMFLHGLADRFRPG